MDDLELTQLFIDYAKLQNQLELIKDMIVHAIIDRGESVKIAGVEAKYYKPSFDTPDYESAAKAYMKSKDIPEAFLEKFSTTTVTVKWKDVCEDFMIVPPPGNPKPARVVLK